MRQEILNLLGGNKVLAGARGREAAETHRVAEPRASYNYVRNITASRSFKIAAIDSLAERLGIEAEDLMVVLGIVGRTAQRRRQDGVLSAEESDRLYRAARIVEKCFDVFGAETRAMKWLKRPQPFAAGAAPLALLGTDAGVETVEHQLGRIDYGDFS